MSIKKGSILPGYWVNIWYHVGRRILDHERLLLARCWHNMHFRVSPSAHDEYYRRYCRRGIYVCAEWHEFEPFAIWALQNGWRPGLVLDRKKNGGNYEPLNCHFVTTGDNCNNRDDNLYLSDGRSLKEAAREAGLTYAALYSRLYLMGWSEQHALSTRYLGRCRRFDDPNQLIMFGANEDGDVTYFPVCESKSYA